jgi:tripartite-type tricarboxylate transporter receptor subunit TctC
MGNAGSHGINAAVYSKLPYDILKDFAPVSQIAIAPNIFVVNPGLPVNTIRNSSPMQEARPDSSRMHPAATAAARTCRWSC